MYIHPSIRRKNKESVLERSRQGVKAKERTRAEFHKGIEARTFAEPNGKDWAEIIVRRSVNGYVQEETLFLDHVGQNSYVVWDMRTQAREGVMGLSKALRLIGKRFPRISAR